MTDNVTATVATPFISWGIPIISAFLGATIALIGREFIEWNKRPRLEIDFEDHFNEKPYIFNASTDTIEKYYLRLAITNKGKCQAKECRVTICVSRLREEAREKKKFNTKHERIAKWSLYNSETFNPLTRSEDKVTIKGFISLNINRQETVHADILELFLNDENSYGLTTSSSPSIIFTNNLTPTNVKEFIEITVYSSNAMPAKFKFIVNWDGTVDGFDKAFTKV